MNSNNSTPIDPNDCQRDHADNAHPGADRPPRTSDAYRAVLHEDIEYDVWLEESLTYVETPEEDLHNDA